MAARKFIASFLLILLPYYDFATCIVIFIKGNTIYAAADTLESLFKSDVRIGFKHIRKIHLKNDVYFAISGHQDSVLRVTAESVIKPGESPESFTATFADRMRVFYNKEMLLLKVAAPKRYKSILVTSLGDVSFFGFRKGTPFVLSVSFKLTETNGNPEAVPTIQDQSRPSASPLGPNVVLGFWDHIVANRPKIYSECFAKAKNNYSDYVALLVKIEVDNHPDTVGCPIDKLILKPNSKPLWSKYYCH
jgi:hypothetical protein